ncbi:hypothetical protein HaLaN_05710, partial [Haematococcus lacustris]
MQKTLKDVFGRQSQPSAAVEDVLAFYPADITSEEKFRSGVAGPKDSEAANRWNAFLPNLTAVRPNVGQKFAQVVHTDGVAISVMSIRPKLAEPPGELPRMGKEEGAVNPLAHLDADWLGCDPRKTNMATVAHDEQYPSGVVKSVWQRSLTAGQYYRQSGITEHAKESKVPAVRRQAAHGGQSVKGAKVRCNSAATGRPLALAYGAAGFSGSGSIGSKGVPVKQMQREARKQFSGRVVLVHEFRTSRVSSARTNVEWSHYIAVEWHLTHQPRLCPALSGYTWRDFTLGLARNGLTSEHWWAQLHAQP